MAILACKLKKLLRETYAQNIQLLRLRLSSKPAMNKCQRTSY